MIHIKPLAHFAVSAVISFAVYSYFRSITCGLVSLICGTFIDLDHLIDYCVSHKFTTDIKSIYRACAETNLKKLYLILHSYELVAILWAAIYIFSLPDIYKAAAIGLTQHIILDQLTNPVKIPGYLITYRIIKNFDTDSLIKKKIKEL